MLQERKEKGGQNSNRVKTIDREKTGSQDGMTLGRLQEEVA